MTRSNYIIAGGVAIALTLVAFALRPARSWRTAVVPSLEDRLPDGGFYNPATQSLLRGKHDLESVAEIEITVDRRDRASIALQTRDEGVEVTLRGVALDQLVPRLHYAPASPPDAFDAFNLMLAEYSRNALSVPVGKRSDEMAHFETNLEEAVPWTLAGDYTFVANPRARPVRFSAINNCLAPGLWELAASDRTGEVYHAWFDMPMDLYLDVAARTNALDRDFVRSALEWNDTPVPLRLERLRNEIVVIGETRLTTLVGQPVGYSSQDSRRKLRQEFVQTAIDGQWTAPRELDDLTDFPSRFSDFVPPGKYSIRERKPFDLRFLRAVRSARVSAVQPLTHYDWRSRPDTTPLQGATPERPNADGTAVRAAAGDRPCAGETPEWLEVVLELEEYVIVIGNLPVHLLVPQEDYEIHGFGVGILSSAGIAERREYLIQDGPPPSYAYLCKPSTTGAWLAVNSHEFGIEQIFIRTHLEDTVAWWEITITSYERIADIVKYRVEIPALLQPFFRTAAMQYVSPLFRTYRDDNIR